MAIRGEGQGLPVAGHVFQSGPHNLLDFTLHEIQVWQFCVNFGCPDICQLRANTDKEQKFAACLHTHLVDVYTGTKAKNT